MEKTIQTLLLNHKKLLREEYFNNDTLNSGQKIEIDNDIIAVDKCVKHLNKSILDSCPDWIHEARVERNDDNYCPICGKFLK